MQFSEDMWDHLPSHLPSRKDRDRLVASAASGDADAVKRLRVWDFFFRPEPKSVAQALRVEIRRQQQAADREQNKGQAESRRLQNALRKHVRRSEDKVDRLTRDSDALAIAVEGHVERRARSNSICGMLGVIAAVGGAI